MGHSIGDGIIVAAVAAAVMAYMYFKHVERRRRLEVIHQERLAAMDKGIPLPELPLDAPQVPRPADPKAPLIHGIVWTSLGLGTMVALLVVARGPLTAFWPLPLPMVFLGVGLMLYYALATERRR